MAEPVITLEQPALARAIGRVTHVVERRSEIQILGNLRLVLCDGGLEITGTDLDIEARALVPCDAGAATIGAGTSVALRLPDNAGSPAVFVPAAEGDGAPDRLIVLMPMRV